MAITIQDPVRLVNVIWYISLVLVFVFCITAIAFGAQNADGDESDSGAVGFAGIWTMLLAIFLAVGGTFVLRRFKTPLAVGFLLGIVVMMCVNMLVLVALLDQETQNCNGLNDRLHDNIDTCQAVGCQKAFYIAATAENDAEENLWMPCCRTFTAIKYGKNPRVYRYDFGASTTVDRTLVEGDVGFGENIAVENSTNSASCPQCDGGECDGSVAAATFAAFLFICYGGFAIALGYFRASIITTGAEEEGGDDEAATGEGTDTAVAYPVKEGTDAADIELGEKAATENL